MNISAPFIRRPIATGLLTVALLLLGLLGYRALPVSSLPTVDFPTIQVTSQLPGASPEVMASTVTAPLERQLGQIAGIGSMISTSSFATSVVTIQFTLSRDIDAAAQDVQAAIVAASGTLARGLPNPPTYSKVNPADTPVMVLALSSDSLPLERVSDAADTLVAQKLAQVEGVGYVGLEGGQRPAVRVQVDPAVAAGLGLTMEDIRSAITQANVNAPKGSFDGTRQSMSIAANDQIASAAAYRPVIVSYRNGGPVRLSDVGTVVDSVENTQLAAWHDGRPAVLLNVQRQPGANIIETVDRIRALLPQLQAALPPQITVSVLTDRTETIRASVADVQATLVLTAGLVVLVIFLFLRSVRATIIPGVALPLSLIGSFGVMALAGFSLDNLSLMALTIASGFVVDDAIVMVENIHRHLEMGKPPPVAAVDGAREIGFTVVSLTVSLIAVFIPLLFMSGVVGRLFSEFAITLSVAVVMSAVISLTLTPMMCARLLRREPPPEERRRGWSERGFDAVQRGYGATLRVVLRHQPLTLLVAVLTLAGTLALYAVVPKGFLPQQDTGVIVAVVDAAPGISFQAMAERQRAVADILRRDPDVAAVGSFVGAGLVNATVNTGRITVALKPHGQRGTAAAVIARLRAAVVDVQGVSVHMQAVQDVQIDARVGRTQYQYVLQDADPAELAAWTQRLITALRARPELADVASDQQPDGLQLYLRIDRDAASRLHVLPQAIDDTLYDAFGQRQVSTIYTQTNQYRVILEAEPAFQRDPSALSRLHVRATGGGVVPLDTLVRMERGVAPLVITRQGQFPAATLSFNLGDGYALGDATRAIQETAAAIGLPDTVTASFTGSAAEFRSSLASQPWLILAAVVAVYIVLGILYESTIHPLTILSTLPSAGIGALVALMVTGEELTLIAMIGIVLLIGIVKKNAIMMIDFALEAERTEGLSPERSIERACLLRFRPIMMTTMAALLGALPLALEQGAGAELRRPLGIAIVGGLLLSQVLTLYTTPVVYLYMDRLGAWLRGARRHPARVTLPASTLPDAARRPAAE
ncbi:multidrug efflux RND transporter permease subunit [Azospirillum sp. RWY-5-1]|uniref:Multidrug efflux RND transporter permease subunit n=1 Tax=Azospirillum oleiclasticum TaxID=2735135 RepID=A0ABX2TH66_9PROT|nr:multidrug efflux RND transporter permease subunit [Azospirillum oleiclasticum]NYZ17196.1 multidrug efflux RND transporter permease subunit [Azospirillum oleiclasticum]NYZ23095.1 multidrug efflux RND transporter permease subunit [Azospirillum oleiclasticum]